MSHFESSESLRRTCTVKRLSSWKRSRLTLAHTAQTRIVYDCVDLCGRHEELCVWMLIKFDWIWCAAYLFTRTLQTVQFGWLPELQRPRRNLGKRCCNKRRSPDAKNLVIMYNLDLINQARAKRSSTTESTFHLSAALCPFLSEFTRSHVLQLFSISRWCYCEWDLEYCAGQVLAMIPFRAHQPPSQCAWVPRRSCSPFMFNSFLLNTNASFISIPLFWLWPAHCFFERKSVNNMNGGNGAKWWMV